MLHLSFVWDNLKDLVKKEVKEEDFTLTYSRKPRVDMGIPPAFPGNEKKARAGAIFDPSQFKGNVMLFEHLNEVSLSMLKHKIPASESSKKKKIIITTINDNYGLKLLAED